MVTKLPREVGRLLRIPPFNYPPHSEREKKLLEAVTPLPSHLALDSKIFTITHNN
jgi:hypothetical protein